ncbi:Uncharacterised protein [Mycobacteroides abscessus subsp. massiliense]|nr:Uncharacterised protein [Mycobacteroides abscessus subsp. massiliense]
MWRPSSSCSAYPTSLNQPRSRLARQSAKPRVLLIFHLPRMRHDSPIHLSDGGGLLAPHQATAYGFVVRQPWLPEQLPLVHSVVPGTPRIFPIRCTRFSSPTSCECCYSLSTRGELVSALPLSRGGVPVSDHPHAFAFFPYRPLQIWRVYDSAGSLPEGREWPPRVWIAHSFTTSSMRSCGAVTSCPQQVQCPLRLVSIEACTQFPIVQTCSAQMNTSTAGLSQWSTRWMVTMKSAGL